MWDPLPCEVPPREAPCDALAGELPREAPWEELLDEEPLWEEPLWEELLDEELLWEELLDELLLCDEPLYEDAEWAPPEWLPPQPAPQPVVKKTRVARRTGRSVDAIMPGWRASRVPPFSRGAAPPSSGRR